MKKNFARIIALILAVLMVAVMFAACKKDKDDKNDKDDKDKTSQDGKDDEGSKPSKPADKKPSGTYKCTKVGDKTVKAYFEEEAEESGMELADLLEYLGMTEDGLGDFIKLTFNDDGTVLIESIFGESEEGNWTCENGVITITAEDEDEDLTATFDGKTIVMEVDDGETYTFSK